MLLFGEVLGSGLQSWAVWASAVQEVADSGGLRPCHELAPTPPPLQPFPALCLSGQCSSWGGLSALGRAAASLLEAAPLRKPAASQLPAHRQVCCGTTWGTSSSRTSSSSSDISQPRMRPCHLGLWHPRLALQTARHGGILESLSWKEM